MALSRLSRLAGVVAGLVALAAAAALPAAAQTRVRPDQLPAFSAPAYNNVAGSELLMAWQAGVLKQITTADFRAWALGPLQFSGTSAGVGGSPASSKFLVQSPAGPSSTANTMLTDGTGLIRFIPNNAAAGLSPMVAAGDNALVFSNSAIDTGALVIAQHSASSRGIKIASDGKVGIGTGSPGYALDVNGSLNATSITVGGAAIGTSKTVRQVVTNATGAVATGTTLIPRDDTIPQQTEGDQYLSASITPTSASSTLLISVTANISNSTAGAQVVCALFQDSTANALKAVAQYMPNASMFPINFRHSMTAGTTSATTFKVRCGGDIAGTVTFNGSAGGRYFGGVMASDLTIQEISP